MMRIVHLIWSFKTGGIETMLIDIVNEQVKVCDVYIYVVNDNYDLDLVRRVDKKVKIVLCRRNPGSNNPYPLLLLNLKLLFCRPDIVHCHQGNLSKIVWLPVKKVLTIHNTHSTTEGYSKYLKLFCISKAVEEYTKNQGYNNCMVVYNGIHTEMISEKQYYPLLSGKLRVICVGRLHKDKGQNLIIEALNELKMNHRVLDVTIDFVGDGDEREFLEKKVRQYYLEDFVNFLGMKPRSWVYSRLKNYDLYVLPSISEGFGLSLAEACAAKLAVLTCDLAGPMEVIDNGRLGMCFTSGDALSLAENIKSFMENGPNVKKIEEAYGFVKEKFDIKKTAETYICEYKKLENDKIER
ncbi:MAG: glycosyltransferase family 4 protein [Bacteroidaceae bacterium]|nr:glycosyltransferase family 4 protein [Bacteroidaceae bacterium]